MVHYGPLGFLYNANIVEQGFAIGIFISQFSIFTGYDAEQP